MGIKVKLFLKGKGSKRNCPTIASHTFELKIDFKMTLTHKEECVTIQQGPKPIDAKNKLTGPFFTFLGLPTTYRQYAKVRMSHLVEISKPLPDTL